MVSNLKPNSVADLSYSHYCKDAVDQESQVPSMEALFQIMTHVKIYREGKSDVQSVWECRVAKLPE